MKGAYGFWSAAFHSDCCDAKGAELSALRERQSRTLRLVLAINVSMFVVELGAGIAARSTALLADSLDMLGDAGVYALSLYALTRSERWRVGASLAKGLVMAAFGAGLVVEATFKATSGVVPAAPLMGVFGLVALAANAVCAWLLLRHRDDDLNLRSAWLCTRNDVLANLGVLAAAAAVAVTDSLWPDVLIGLAIAAVVLRSAVGVVRDSARALRDADGHLGRPSPARPKGG
ncbi:MAG: cation transporter [Gammaproteobacteria bacterium]|nr:cation transporter [Gammaproteobacteria bacterium]NIR85221.1 cation transporter [Gammaproteobacteria bacterium]NIR92093.1 cation transporter [Gammaproteobacteria bacterium]NIU06274.1 cation transporter [Gammaproteobacteria bacterium]NIV53181.1 cation diffusion facilitator family transporter [Gammaproteobacteria bacterium]